MEEIPTQSTHAQNLSPKSFIESINQSNHHLVRTLVFFATLLILVMFLLSVFLKSITESGELKAEFNNDGRLVFEVKKSNIFSNETNLFISLLLPSNVVWFDTGIELKPNQQCEFKVTGSVHLSVRALVEAATLDQRISIPWSTPDGSEWAKNGETVEQINFKKKLLLNPGNKIGNVIGFYMPTESVNNFNNYFDQNRNDLTYKIFEINKGVIKKNETGKTVKLYLSVNDILLSFAPNDDFSKGQFNVKTSEIAYIGRKKDQAVKWKEILTDEYDNLYFDDNVGNFMVQVEITDTKDN